MTQPHPQKRARRRKTRWTQKLAQQLLPRSWRNAMIRRAAEFDLASMEDVTVEVARTIEDYVGAFSLVHDEYVWRGWIQPQPSGMWITHHHLFPESTVLVLKKAGQVIGTVTVYQDSKLGMPIEETYPEELAALRRSGRRLVESGPLAVAPAYKKTGLFLCLVVSEARFMQRHLGATDLVTAVDAHIEPYYEALFGARRFGPVRSYSGFAGDAVKEEDPVVALRIDLETVEHFIAAAYDEPAPGKFNVASLVFKPYPALHEVWPPVDAGRDELARWKLPRHVFQQLFIRKTHTLTHLTPLQRQQLTGVRTLRTLTAVPLLPATA